MKVSKAQAEANRAHVVETASRLFRERGFDGVGVAELMAAAGFTHGGFYKQFGSKADLMAESTACGIGQTLAMAGNEDAAGFLTRYLSREHRDQRATGCAMAALGGDTARQPEAVREAFAAGVEQMVTALSRQRSPAGDGDDDPARARARLLDLMAHVVGALVLSRACPDDSALADDFLSACREALLGGPAPRPAARRRRRLSAGKPPPSPSA